MTSNNSRHVRKKSKVYHNKERTEVSGLQYKVSPPLKRSNSFAEASQRGEQNESSIYVPNQYENRPSSVGASFHVGGLNATSTFNEFDRFVGHQDFEKFVELAYKVKVMRHAIASKDVNRKLNMNISELSQDFATEDDSRRENGFAETSDYIKRHAMTEKYDGDEAAYNIARGVYPRTDSLLDETIDALTQEFEKCKLHYSLLKKDQKLAQKSANTLDTSNESPEGTIRVSRKKNKKVASGESPKESIAIKYSKYQTDILTEWMVQHRSHPFPNSAQIKALCEATNLNYSQVVNWTTNVRKRNLKATVEGGKKPHHFLDFLFLAEHRDKQKLQNTSSNYFHNTDVKRTPDVYTGVTTNELSSKKGNDEFKNKVESPYFSTRKPSGTVPNDVMSGNMAYYHGSMHQPNSATINPSFNTAQRLNYPSQCFPVASYDSDLSPNSYASKSFDKFHPTKPPPVYNHLNRTSNAYSMLRSNNDSASIKIKREDTEQKEIFSSPSFDAYDTGSYPPPRKISKKNVVTPEHYKKKRLNDRFENVSSRKCAFPASEKMEIDAMSDYEPLDVHSEVWNDGFEFQTGKMDAKLLQLCRNMNDESLDANNEIPRLESYLPEIFVSDKESDSTFSNPFDERDDCNLQSFTSTRTYDTGDAFQRDNLLESSDGNCRTIRTSPIKVEKCETPLLNAVEELNIEDWMDQNFDEQTEQEFFLDYFEPSGTRAEV